MKISIKLIFVIILSFIITACKESGADDNDDEKPVPVNIQPVANIASNSSVNEQQQANLNGRASSDSDGTIISHQWVQTGGIAVTISNATQPEATLTAPEVSSDTQITIELTVTDNEGATNTDSITVTIINVVVEVPNTAPVADITSNSSVTELQQMSLDGSASSDSDGTITSYQWVQTGGIAVTILNATESEATFTAPEVNSDTQVTIELTVTDDKGATNSDTTTVTIINVVVEVPNIAPIAAITSNSSVTELQQLSLDASTSSDSDGTITSYQWVQTGGVGVVISNANQSVAAFIAPEVDSDTQVTFQLTVTDDDGASSTNTITITIINLVEQDQAPSAIARDLQFYDQDTDSGEVQGDITITPANDEANIEFYRLEWRNSGGEVVDFIVDINATGADLKHTLPVNTPLPADATQISVYSGNSFGIAENGFNININDRVVSSGAGPQKLFFIGHSLVNFKMPTMTLALANSRSSSLIEHDLQIINGSPLTCAWDYARDKCGNPNPDTNAREALATGVFDALIMTERVPLESTIRYEDSFVYAKLFYDLAIESNPNATVYFYETWNCINSGTTGCDYDPNDDIPWRERFSLDLPLWQSIIDHVNNNSEGPEMKIIPGGHALGNLYDAIQAGQVPGITQLEQLFADDIHLNEVGNYYIALVHYAVLYQTSPVGMIHDNIPNQWGVNYNAPTPEQAAIFQTLAWQTVQEFYPDF